MRTAEYYDLAWGTSWTAADRPVLATVLDLPTIVAAITLPTGQFDPAHRMPAIDLVANGRSLAWIDDMITIASHTWASQRHAATLLAIDLVPCLRWGEHRPGLVAAAGRRWGVGCLIFAINHCTRLATGFETYKRVKDRRTPPPSIRR